MLAIFGRKKLTTERTAQIIAHHIVEVTEAGFPDLAGFINDSPEFMINPNLQSDDYGKFLMIVIAGNYSYLPQYFLEGQDKEIITACNEHFATAFGMTKHQFEETLKDYKSTMQRANFPSKNIISAMCKGIFLKYNLSDFQEEYFREMRTPNPIFLKNLGDVVKNFLVDWEAFKEKYKVVGAQG